MWRFGCVVYKIKEYKIRIVKTFINYDYHILLKYKQLNIDTMTVINTFMNHFTFDRKELTEVICVDEFLANFNHNNKNVYNIKKYNII